MEGNEKRRGIFLILLFAALFLFGWIWERRGEKKHIEKEISGIIINKYRDNSFNGRQAPMLTVVNENDTVEFCVFMWCTDFFWKYIKIGDSISKPSGTLPLMVFKPSGESKLFKYDIPSDRKKEKRFFFKKY